MEKIKEFILTQFASQKISHEDAKQLLLELHNSEQAAKNEAEMDIAIIGMSCRFADSDTPDEFWGNLVDGKVCFVDYQEERKKFFAELTKNPHYAEFLGHSVDNSDGSSIKAGYLKDIEMFDANFFGIPAREATSIDPAHRMILELSWSAIEDAGYSEDMIRNTNTGVYIGRDCTSGGTFYRYVTEATDQTLTGTWHGLMASRLNYLFNLRGPSMVVDTACSSGLVAIHTACQALRSNECEMAIAGGISLGSSAQGKNEEDEDAGVLNSVSSDDNIVRTFDKNSTGTVFGEGVAVVFLKPLSKAIADRDNIYAVIKGSAANNDGASNGITSPNPIAQEEVILKAWEQAGVNPETIGYIEAHGTGTLLGDPLEIKGLTNAFRRYTDKKQFCGIGSAKTNMGHLVGASGVVGFMKTALSLKNKQIPASLHFEEPNPHINFVESPLYVVDQLKEWQNQGDSPLRAGISAFGFSGTNCHVLLEESPAVAVSAPTGLAQILTLSGKSEVVLTDLIESYHAFLEKGTQEALENIAFTANTGRGHYEYRLALIVHSLDELKEKIAAIRGKQLNEIAGEGIWLGKHKVVSDKKSVKAESEISDREKRELSNLVKQSVQNAQDANGGEIVPALSEIAKLYVQGATVEWNALYAGQQLKRVSLPVYPFERTPYWAEIKHSKVAETAVAVKQMDHPMLDRCVSKTINQDVYVVNLEIQKHWVLSDHVLFGVSIVPGTAHIEVARELASLYYPGSKIEFNDITFLSPVSVREGESKPVQYVVQKDSDSIKISAMSQLADENGELIDQWNLHVQMKVSPFDETNDTVHPVQELRHSTDFREIKIDLEAITSKSGRVTFGPRWLNVTYVARSEKEVFAELHLPADCQGDLDSYKLHPGMLDNAMNSATQSFGDGMYLPLSYRSFKLYSDMPEHFYTHIRKKDRDSKNLETLTFDVYLLDSEGRVFAEIEDYVIKKVQAQALKELNQYHYYETKWIAKSLQEVSSADASEAGSVIVLKDATGFADRLIPLLGTKHRIVEVASDAFDFSEEGILKLVEEAGGDSIRKILYLMPVMGSQQVASMADLQVELEKGMYGLFHLSRGLFKAKLKNEIEFTVVTDNAHLVSADDGVVHAHHGSLLGLLKVVAQEFPNLVSRSIDVDARTSLEVLAAELQAPVTDSRVAFRNNARYVEQFQRVNMNAQRFQEMPVNEGGVYVITGGTGGIGLSLTKHLSTKGAMTFALLNRSSLPDRDQWDEIIAGGENAGLIAKLVAIREIEASGSTVACYSTDMSDEASLSRTLDQIRGEFGKINGVFHCAGVAGDGMLVLKDKAVFDSVVKPKVEGTWLLDTLTRQDELDLFVCFSSISTLFGARGQGDYTAANSYLDAFAHSRRALGLRTNTINWPAWSEVGMAVDFQVSDDYTLFQSVSNEKAFHFFDEIMGLNLTNVIPGSLNLTLLSAIEDQLPIQLATPIKNDLATFRGRAEKQEKKAGGEKKVITEVMLSGKGEDEYTDIERKIGFIYGVGLGLEMVDIFENFNALGGDSILATELAAVIDKEYPGIVDISDMFSYASVSEMAEYIESKLPKQAQVV